MRLCENINSLIISTHNNQSHGIRSNMLVNKVIINLYIFGVLIKNIIVSNLHGTCIAKVNDGGRRLSNAYGI